MSVRRVLSWGLKSLGSAFVFACASSRPVQETPGGVPVAPLAMPAPIAEGAPVRTATEDPRLAAIDEAVRQALADRKLPGCVVVVGRRDEILFQKAYGFRQLDPVTEPMTVDTIFDLASLTKPIATATSVMLLAEEGKLRLDAPISEYLEPFRSAPSITVEQLLLHVSGLPAVTSVAQYTQVGDRLVEALASVPLKAPPGTRFVYSDSGFVLLAEIVRKVSGQSLDTFARTRIFEPLSMSDTGFLPRRELVPRIAPTERREGAMLRGVVHDPRAFALGGVSGHAGLFGTASDVARFARMLLNRGSLEGQRVAAEASIQEFTRARPVPSGHRTLGWDVETAFSRTMRAGFSRAAFGHGGFTGTAIWIDPELDLFVVFLSNRVHPDGKGQVNPLVGQINGIATDAIVVEPGIDTLRARDFAPLRGRRVGVVTNVAALTKDGAKVVDLLLDAVDVRAIFSPEHGLGATREGRIEDSTYRNVPVRSLYGRSVAPAPEALSDVDVLAFDLQDVGVRFYTYASTLHELMKVAAARGLPIVILDRPNPLGGIEVAGPTQAEDVKSFVHHFPLPIRHGMTMGELALMMNDEEHLGAKVEVMPVRHWRRRDWYDRTGLPFRPPSPNLRTFDEVLLYPAVGLLESSKLSVGRGTSTPFEVIGAPWIDARRLAGELQRALPALDLTPTEFTPSTSLFSGRRCEGVKLRVRDRRIYEPMTVGLTLARTLHRLYPEHWDVRDVERMVQRKDLVQGLVDGKDVSELASLWQTDVARFRERRAKYLLYAD